VPDFAIDLLERFFHPLFDLLALLMQVFEPSDMLHPRLFLGCSFQFFLDRLSDELAQRNTALGGGGFCAAEQEVGNFKGRLHGPILPYLWVCRVNFPLYRAHGVRSMPVFSVLQNVRRAAPHKHRPLFGGPAFGRAYLAGISLVCVS